MRTSSRTKVFDGKRYTLYTNFSGLKRQATAEATRLRKTGDWLVRMIKSPWGGYDIYVRDSRKAKKS